MNIAYLIATVLLATVVHALVLRMATNLMVEVRIRYSTAYKIVVTEYVAAGVIAGILLVSQIFKPTASYIVAAIVLVSVGATCIGRWLSFGNGDRVGVGNGVLIQFMQIPLVVPFAIILSFLFNASH